MVREFAMADRVKLAVCNAQQSIRKKRTILCKTERRKTNNPLSAKTGLFESEE